MFAAADLANLLVDKFSRLSGGRFAVAFILAGFLYRASLRHDQISVACLNGFAANACQSDSATLAWFPGTCFFRAGAPHGNARGYFPEAQAVCPGSKSEGVFFLRCGTIFAGSGFPGTPRGPSCSR
jgi:hypothetical protein